MGTGSKKSLLQATEKRHGRAVAKRNDLYAMLSVDMRSLMVRIDAQCPPCCSLCQTNAFVPGEMRCGQGQTSKQSQLLGLILKPTNELLFLSQKLATCQIHSWLPCGYSSFKPAHSISPRCIVQRRRHSTCRPVSQILWLCSNRARTRHPDLQATPGPDKRHSTTYCTSRTSIEIQSSSALVVSNGDRSRRSPHL